MLESVFKVGMGIFLCVTVVSIEFNIPECTEAGCDAVIKFSAKPANEVIMNPLIRKVKGKYTVIPSTPEVMTDNDKCIIDLKRGEIVFPKVTVEDAGSYEFSCNGNSSHLFQLNVTPKKSKHYLLQ